MFIAWAGRAVLFFAILTVIYIALSIYNRWAERRRLEAEFEHMSAQGEVTAPDRETFVAGGMNDYERSLKRKLLLGVYLIPLGVLMLLVALAQFG